MRIFDIDRVLTINSLIQN